MTLMEGSYKLNGSDWVPLEELPTAESASELYQFSEELTSAEIANVLHLGSKTIEVKGLPTPVLTWQVFVPPCYMGAWETAQAEFLKNARTRFDLPIAGSRCKLFIAVFASHIRNIN